MPFSWTAFVSLKAIKALLRMVYSRDSNWPEVLKFVFVINQNTKKGWFISFSIASGTFGSKKTSCINLSQQCNYEQGCKDRLLQRSGNVRTTSQNMGPVSLSPGLQLSGIRVLVSKKERRAGGSSSYNKPGSFYALFTNLVLLLVMQT